jgi:hypothetical protein
MCGWNKGPKLKLMVKQELSFEVFYISVGYKRKIYIDTILDGMVFRISMVM